MNKSKIMLAGPILAGLLVILAFSSALGKISNMEVSNLRSSSATISWTTPDSTDGCVHYGLTGGSLSDTTCDPRPDDDIHFVQLSGLSTDTTYHFEVASGGEIDSNGGSYYTFRTTKVGIAVPYTIYGVVDPAAGAIVSVVVKSQSGDSSCPLSALDDALGVWFFNLGNLKDLTTNDVFSYSVGDSILVSAEAAADGEGRHADTVSGESPQACDTLVVATRGDANGDGTIDVGDIVFLVNYLLLGAYGPDPLEAGDADCNGEVDVGDVIYLVNYLLLGGWPPGC